MQKSSFAAGDSIAARCTKCRKNTDHHIVTLTAEGPGLVRCNACSHRHKYRLPSAAKKGVPARSGNNREAERLEWECLELDRAGAKVIDYSMTAAFKVENVISHPIFGLGLVQRLAGPQKVEVLFADGKKTMRCK